MLEALFKNIEKPVLKRRHIDAMAMTLMQMYLMFDDASLVVMFHTRSCRCRYLSLFYHLQFDSSAFHVNGHQARAQKSRWCRCPRYPPPRHQLPYRLIGALGSRALEPLFSEAGRSVGGSAFLRVPWSPGQPSPWLHQAHPPEFLTTAWNFGTTPRISIKSLLNCFELWTLEA